MGTFADGETGLSVRTKINAAIETIEAITPATIKTDYESNLDTNAYTDAEQTKLAGIESLADVTDTTNVTAAGALMDGELTDIAAVKALDQGVATTDSPTFADIAATSLVTDNSQSYRNKIINGNFAVNQRAKSGTVTLAAGEYGHDRWKGGASGATYTFATSANVTTITITAGSLIQVVKGSNLQSGTHTLSWTGTAQGKIGAGSYSAAGVTGTATGGTNLNIEFNTGTLSLVELEPGSVATAFEHMSYEQELHRCLPYYWRSTATVSTTNILLGVCYNASNMSGCVQFPVPMIAAPHTFETTGTASDYVLLTASGVPVSTSVPTMFNTTKNVAQMIGTSTSGFVAGQAALLRMVSAAYVAWSAEL